MKFRTSNRESLPSDAGLTLQTNAVQRQDFFETCPSSVSKLTTDPYDLNERLRQSDVKLQKHVIRLRQLENKLMKSNAKLQRVLEQTVSVLSLAMEIKDPYTADHQKNVAQVAGEVAKVMGLNPQRAKGLEIAAYIHDIGKIKIPSEILNKSGTLNQAEYAVIQTHCQAGYDILKDIEFPWDIAEIIRQHHERWDGSGYMKGLQGEEIKLEARILAVADVVDSMASRRPYREALGIDMALAEIESHQGSLYDPQVVQACLYVFEKGYCHVYAD